jgi:hypothetical protein
MLDGPSLDKDIIYINIYVPLPSGGEVGAEADASEGSLKL